MPYILDKNEGEDSGVATCPHDNFDEYFGRCEDCGYEPPHAEMFPDSEELC